MVTDVEFLSYPFQKRFSSVAPVSGEKEQEECCSNVAVNIVALQLSWFLVPVSCCVPIANCLHSALISEEPDEVCQQEMSPRCLD